jgi:hypothetical protein
MPRRSAVRRPRSNDPRLLALSKRVTVAVALLTTGAVYALPHFDDNVVDVPLLLFVVPIAFCAVRFGLQGGLTSALVGCALTTAWYVQGDVDAGPIGYISQATALLVMGILVGHYVDRRRAVEELLARHEELSLDLLCTANFDGYFTRLSTRSRMQRPYKEAWSVDRAVAEVHRLRGVQFDPDVVEAFDHLDAEELAETGGTAGDDVEAAA